MANPGSYQEMVCGAASSNVVLPVASTTCQVAAGIRALGTTAMEPCASGSTKLNVMCCVAPSRMSIVAPSRIVGPSAPLATTELADGDEMSRA